MSQRQPTPTLGPRIGIPTLKNLAVVLLRGSLLAVLLLLLLQVSPAAWGQQAHTPIVDGDDVNHPVGHVGYKGLYHGYLYGHWNDVGRQHDTTGHHHDVGVDIANNKIHPLCLGCPVVVLGLGFSNWTKELCGEQTANVTIQTAAHPNCVDPITGLDNGWSFINKVSRNTQLKPGVIFVDCAIIGAVAEYWTSNDPPIKPVTPDIPQDLYQNCQTILAGLNLSENDVQVVLYKNADSGRQISATPNHTPLIPLPAYPATFPGCGSYQVDARPDVCVLMKYFADTARYIRSRYPNVQQMFFHSRTYGGYAHPQEDPPGDETQKLNPEPFAYEQGFAIKWLIQAQIDEMNDPNHTPDPYVGPLDYDTNHAPWMDWGAYLWASGTDISCLGCGIASPGLTWKQAVRYTPNCNQPGYPACGCDPMDKNEECDFQSNDNTHPSLCGRDKVSNMLWYNYCNNVDYMKPWILSGQTCAMPQPTNTCKFGQ